MEMTMNDIQIKEYENYISTKTVDELKMIYIALDKENYPEKAKVLAEKIPDFDSFTQVIANQI